MPLVKFCCLTSKLQLIQFVSIYSWIRQVVPVINEAVFSKETLWLGCISCNRALLAAEWLWCSLNQHMWLVYGQIKVWNCLQCWHFLLFIIIITWLQLHLKNVFTVHFIGGSFVCKLFDLFTKFSVGLVYLLYRAFNRVAIFKPVTSRPANSERWRFALRCVIFIFEFDLK